THYRAPLNFSFEALDQAENALQRYNDFIVRIMDVRESAGVSSIAEDSNPVKFKELEIIGKLVASTKKGFCEAMDDDLNISRALAEISEFVRKVNIMIDRNEIGPGEAEMVYGFMKEINSVLGVFTLERELLPEEIEELIRKRAEARKVRNFAEADRIRDELMKMGIILEDTKEGTRWKRKI
ncbi:MAG: cysteine--tRNA ligase, partial [Spirochaetes bacterium]